MILAKLLRYMLIAVCLGGLLLPAAYSAGRRYGPTAPGGYYVRLEPRTLSMAHSQRPRLTVLVENAAGEPLDDIPVRFVPSEGVFTTEMSRTRGGQVSGMFSAGTGSDSPRQASIVVTVENVEVIVYVDIVPAVFGR